MSMYQPGIPTGTVNLDVDYQNLQDNFQQLDTSFGVDHVPFSVNTADDPAGYHQSVHYVPFSTTVTNPPNNFVATTVAPQGVPAATPGFGQVFSAQVNDGLATDDALFYLSGGNRLTALTRNLTPISTNNTDRNGYTFLPGGIIFQWGFVAGSSSSSIAVLFATSNINFPSKCFSAFAIPIRAASSPGSDFSTCIVTSTVSTTGFTIGNIGGHTMAGWYWWAIGR